MEKIKIVVVEPHKDARITEIEDSLEAMQKTVGGYIQALYPYKDNVAIVCNDEGKIDGLSLNRALKDDNGNVYDIIAGTFFVTGLSDDDFDSLSPEQAQVYLDKFKNPEIFARFGNEIIAIPVDKGMTKGKEVKM